MVADLASMDDEAASSQAQTAIQYLVWAIEEIEKTGNKEAAQHARVVLKALQESVASRRAGPRDGRADGRSRLTTPRVG
jgi:hypothetical protein